ncbi:hypothetical protein TomMM35A_21240 [Sphingobium sp. TomMM35A]
MLCDQRVEASRRTRGFDHAAWTWREHFGQILDPVSWFILPPQDPGNRLSGRAGRLLRRGSGAQQRPDRRVRPADRSGIGGFKPACPKETEIHGKDK